MSEMHPRPEEIQDLVEGRLPDEARRSIETHLDGCERCTAERERITATRRILRSGVSEEEEIPQILRDRVDAALQKADARGARRWMLPAGLAAAAVLAIALTLLLRQPATQLPAEAVRDLMTVSSGRSPLELQTSDAAQLQSWFDGRLGFSTRVFDLGMMGYRLIGGRVDELAGKPSALFVYRRDDGALVVCEMVEGDIAALPPAAERRRNNGIDFFIFDHDGATAVFWQEGPVMCVLVSRINREDVIALAYAKAMQPV